jgi:hypothetical protein
VKLKSACRLGFLVVSVAGMSLVGMATAASAAPAQSGPIPTAQTFNECPVGAGISPASKGNTRVDICVYGVAQDGTIDIGGLDTTFTGPGVVQGGSGLLGRGLTWADALNGQSYTAPKQLLAMSVENLIGNPTGITPPANSQVWVETAQAGAMAFGLGTGGGLAVVTQVPLTFHLVNPLLGPNCYVGTASDPVVLNLTTGTSGALTGSLGTVDPYGSFAGGLYTVDSEVVDNQFTVPSATGCGSGGVWDSAITALEGADLPGSNTAILYGNYDLALAKWVKKNGG